MVADESTVWIDDPHPIFRRGMAACLTADGFRIAGESVGLEPAPRPGVDVIIFSAQDGGLARIVGLCDEDRPALVATVRHPSEEMLADIVEGGVVAILLRQDLQPSALVTTVRAALQGQAALPNKILHRLLDRAATGDRHNSTGLTVRERRVLALLADGSDTRGIADELCYSERTIKNIVHDLLTKMNCRNRAHAVAQAARQGVI